MAAAHQVEVAQEWLHLSRSLWSIAWRCSKWGWMDPGEQLCWWGGTGGVSHQCAKEEVGGLVVGDNLFF